MAQSSDDNDVIFEARDLRIHAVRDDGSELPIVKGVDFKVRRGEVVALIGESGSGKTTISLSALGYCKPGLKFAGGEALLLGQDVTKMSTEELRPIRGEKVAYLAQSAAATFNPSILINEQVTEAPVLHGSKTSEEAGAKALSLYHALELPDPENIGARYPHQVSGGQLQRAMTAMAMSCRPDLIIFDEPTTALDVTTQIEVLVAIREIVEQFQTAAIYITHDLAVVAQMADRVKVLLRGDEVEEADTRTMLDAPREDYTKSLWAVRSFQRPQKPLAGKGTVPVISLRNVTAAYGSDDPVVRDVSFDIHEGRTVAVVGESGSGKSTTARCITGLLPPMTGEIAFRNEVLPADYRKRSVHQLRQVQMIYQMADTALNPRKRIGEIIGRPVEFYLGLKGAEKRRRVEELLELIEMNPKEYINRLPSELSGGQKQRIGIARALAAEPKFIICDEVTSALDQLVAEGILKLLTRLQEEMKLSYMLITHDLSTVRAIADEVVVMKDGLIVEAGPKDEMFTPPHHAYTDLLLSSVPEMNPDWLDELLARRGAENLGDAAVSKM